MDEFARWPADDRADLFAAAASNRGLNPAIMEKDFWVCWTLRRVFTLPQSPAGLIFKGGTSLSKAYGVIERFSEDVDLAFDRTDLGFGGDRDPMAAPTRKKRRQSIADLKRSCIELVAGRFLNLLSEHCALAIGKSSEPWKLAVAEDDPLTLLFTYPRKQDARTMSPYVRPAVRLEFGARSDHWPAEDATITPYVAEEFPDRIPDAVCHVRVLSGARTFWEKATILHQWHHAPDDKAFPDRQSRHYYDLACLAEHEIAGSALADLDLLARVADHKSVFFESAWPRYDLARPGTLRLLPQSTRLKALETDYAKMREMIFGEPPRLEWILSTLKSLEAKVNA